MINRIKDNLLKIQILYNCNLQSFFSEHYFNKKNINMNYEEVVFWHLLILCFNGFERLSNLKTFEAADIMELKNKLFQLQNLNSISFDVKNDTYSAIIFWQDFFSKVHNELDEIEKFINYEIGKYYENKK